MLRWRHIRSILLLPTTVTIVIPALILARTRPAPVGWGLPAPWQLVPLGAGILCLAAGVRLVAQTIALFASHGRGTLAPWDPPARLVVQGVYRHVRNPMISGVIAILAGESLALGSRPLAAWCGIFTAVNMLYIPLLEEPQLEARFGAAYRAYKRHVPRWIPRRRPWEGAEEREPGQV
jgi:protein-S-isoprenylcysteine O-methyltransferase Ste14